MFDIPFKNILLVYVSVGIISCRLGNDFALHDTLAAPKHDNKPVVRNELAQRPKNTTTSRRRLVRLDQHFTEAMIDFRR